jgi:16S rRNA (guanine527-N7)-methyltransferase
VTTTSIFDGFPLEERIEETARKLGIEAASGTVAALAEHARDVARANPLIHLTAIVDPEEFVRRHVGESLAGAAVLPRGVAGTLVDLGSGNGYPGIPLGIARPDFRVVLAEASIRKAAFLREAIARCGPPAASVLEAHIQRARDLAGLGPVRVVATRAMGNWDRVLPRLVAALEPEGRVLLWAGSEVETVMGRAVWSKMNLVGRTRLPCREHSWIWQFVPA